MLPGAQCDIARPELLALLRYQVFRTRQSRDGAASDGG
jgi:hypothetical protein